MRAADLATIAPIPDILITIGACSRLEPSPRFLPATRIALPSPSIDKAFALEVNPGAASSRTCLASSGKLLLKWANRPGIISSVEILSPSLMALPLRTSSDIVTPPGNQESKLENEKASRVAGISSLIHAPCSCLLHSCLLHEFSGVGDLAPDG